MKRTPALAVAFLGLVLLALPAIGQEQVNPLDPIFDFFQDPANETYVSQFLKQPIEGKSHVTDPVGDFEHSTGQPPGYTPDHLDITEAWAVEFDPGPMDLFGPTDENNFWAPTGPYEVTPPNYPPFTTFTGDIPHDGSQFADGAILFGFFLADTPPVQVLGRCEFVVWVNDSSRGPTWVNNPGFPQDPAGDTNVAFGLGINPEGQGAPSNFTLDLQKTGGFASDPNIDVRSFITPNYVGILVPKSQIGFLAGVNYYTFCVEEGFSFAPEDSGADQTGLIEMTFDDLGQLVIEAQPVEVETTTTTIVTTTSSTVAATTTVETSPSTSVVEGPTAEEGEFPWWLLILGGIGLAALGWWLLARGDPCKELFDAWMAAQRACDEAQKRADEAADDCMEAELDLEDLEEERKKLCQAWPPACWTTEDGSWVEDEEGNRITSRDLHMKKMALGEIWDDYKAKKLTAQEVEAKWKEMDTPEFREEMRETDEAFKDLLSDIDADIAEAGEAAKEACDRAVESQAAADEACVAAEAARKAYEECIGAAVAAAGAAAGGGTEGGPEGPSGPGGSTPGPGEQVDPCKDVEPKRRHDPAGKADQIRVNVDFSIIIGRYEGSERNVAAGERLVIDLQDVARDLDFAGDMLNARSAGLHVGGAANGYAQGKYVATAAGVIRGGIDATMATTDLLPDVPTTPVQAGTEFLEKTASLGAFVAGKVTEWMRNYQIFTVRRSFFYQVITATPYYIMECRTGQGWVCVEKVWEFDVGKLRVLKGSDRWFTVNSSVRRAQFDRAVRDLSQSAADTIKNDARRLVEWRATHEPGPCP